MGRSGLGINEMKRRNKAKGDYWFSDETMRVWESKIHGITNELGFFISSEKGPHQDRVYSIRCFIEDGSVRNFISGEFKKLSDAKNWLEWFTYRLKIEMGNREREIFNDLWWISVSIEFLPKKVYQFETEQGDYFLIDINTNDRMICG